MEIPKEEATPLVSSISKPPMITMFPSPGMGHLIPMIEFSKRLILHQNLQVTIIIPTEAPPSKAQTTVLQSLPKSISHIFLPPVNLTHLPSDSKIETIMCHTVLESLPSLRKTFTSLSTTHTITAFLVDLFATDAFDVAGEFNVPRYVFYPTNAMVLSLFFYLNCLDQEVRGDCEYRELTEPVKIPGCIPIHGKDLFDPVQDRKNDCYKWVLHITKRYREADGIINNSFLELEPGPITELLKTEPGRPPVYPVGPLVKIDGFQNGVNDSACLSWLDEQPLGSVLFVSFGSGGTLSSAQITELALGLEMSEQRFLWVVRSPNDRIANASYFTADTDADPFDFLPKGFVERTKGRGFLVSSWAPQPQVLAHGSTGGFLSHCGWNSILESVVNGVPLVAWPLFAEQKMNAIMLCEDVKVALRPKVLDDSGLVERLEIASVVKSLMEGEEGKKVRYRMKELKEAAAKTLGENGSSTNYISNLALKWSNTNNSTTTTVTN